MYESRNPPQEPPCQDCRVTVLPENQEAAKIFDITRHQLIVGMSGVVDINQLAVHEAMRVYNVKDRRKCFEKVIHLGMWWVSRLNQKDE